MKRAALAILFLAASAILPVPASARDGVITADRWTFVRSFVDPQDQTKTHWQFRLESFDLRTDGVTALKSNSGIFDYVKSSNGAEDDTFAISQRQSIAGRFIMVEYALDTDPDKARYTKQGAALKLNQAADPVSWVPVSLGDSAATISLDSAWNSLRSLYDQNTGNPTGLGAALVSWLLQDFAGLSFLDQLTFASGASRHDFLGANLREIESALRGSGFPLDLSRLLPTGGVDLALNSTPSVTLNGTNLSLAGVSITNNRTASSGPLRLDVYAFRAPYQGGPLPVNTYPLATITLSDSLAAGGHVTNASYDSSVITSLPEGIYYLAVILSDATGRKDYAALPNSLLVGTPVGAGAGEQNMPTQLINLSTRLRVEAGENVGIGGFVISGSGSKRVILRAVGPSLTGFGVTGALSATSIELRNSAGALVSQNTRWQDSQRDEIQASGFPPADPRESAIVATLSAGSYTLIVRGAGGEMGVVLIEMYDLERSSSTLRPINVSTRGRVQSGDNVMIGGFVIGGNRVKRVLVRAVGPSLTRAGVAGALSDPTLVLYDKTGAVLAQNDDWMNSDLRAQISATAFAPTDAKESAIIMSLAPGPYTAVVRSKDGTPGVALVEVYDLD